MKYAKVNAQVDWKTFKLLETENGDYIYISLQSPPNGGSFVISLKPTKFEDGNEYYCWSVRLTNDLGIMSGQFEYKGNPRMNLRDFATNALQEIKSSVWNFNEKMHCISNLLEYNMIDCGVFESKEMPKNSLTSLALDALLKYQKNPEKYYTSKLV